MGNLMKVRFELVQLCPFECSAEEGVMFESGPCKEHYGIQTGDLDFFREDLSLQERIEYLPRWQIIVQAYLSEV